MGFLSDFLQHPLTRGMDLDNPETTLVRKQVVQEKQFLKKIYEEWYSLILQELPPIEGKVLEIGTGAGFLQSFIPDLITSDVMPLQCNDLAIDAHQLPIKSSILRAIILINVLHHIRDPEEFFKCARNSLRPNGKIILIEPWVSAWSRLIYSKFHHEPFAPHSESWILPESGPLSGGNDAMPWIIFYRDKKLFFQKTNLEVISIKKLMPFRYLTSGGISLRNLIPSFLFNPLKYFELLIPESVMNHIAMFAIITLKKSEK